MSNLKKLIYTLLLAVTCVFASPFIFRQIWNKSDLKQVRAAKKEPTLSSAADPASGEQTTTAPANAQPTSEGETAPADNAETPTEPAPTQNIFVQSGTEYFDDALFIGDSRTVGLKDYGTLKNADYFCDIGLSAYKIDNTTVGGSTVWGKLNARKYGKIYVMLGINEVGNDIESTAASYRKLVDGIRQVQPDAVLYLEGNLHVTYAAQTSLISNERIDMLNAKLREIAESNTNTYYLEVNSVFDDEYGALTSDYTEDGIHVFAKYYPIWCDWLCQNTVSQGGAPAAEPAPAEATAAPAEEKPAETEPTTEARPQNEEFSNR